MRSFARCTRTAGARAIPRPLLVPLHSLGVVWAGLSTGGTPCRWCSSQATGTSTAGSASAFDQFTSQRAAYHRHSFHEGGSTHGRRAGSSASREGGDADGEAGSAGAGASRAEQFARSGGARTSATARERRDMSRSWENAFFARVHYQEGMHARFRSAIDAEEHERLSGMTNEELFPDWAADEEAPPHLFAKLSPAMQLRYVLNRLSMGERRIRYAPDYGSLSMMYQLGLGERMVAEAEHLLQQLGWLNEELEAKLEEVKAIAAKVKYDYDLD